MQYQDIGYCTYFLDKLKIKWILNGVVVPFDSSVKKKENMDIYSVNWFKQRLYTNTTKSKIDKQGSSSMYRTNRNAPELIMDLTNIYTGIA